MRFTDILYTPYTNEPFRLGADYVGGTPIALSIGSEMPAFVVITDL